MIFLYQIGQGLLFKRSYIKTLSLFIIFEETCLYGDAQGVVIRSSTKNITCSFEDIKDNPSICYDVKNQCCQQCRHFYTGIAGMELAENF